MQFRCAQCKALTNVEIPPSGTSPFAVACSGCGRRYNLSVHRPANAADQEPYRPAKSYSEEDRIDLAAAYSVLEGLMPLDEARALRQEGASRPSREAALGGDAMPRYLAGTKPQGAAPAAPAPPTPRASVKDSAAGTATRATSPSEMQREVAYDPGFASAVAAGSLTVQQAIERGDRRALSARLAQRHRLPSHL